MKSLKSNDPLVCDVEIIREMFQGNKKPLEDGLSIFLRQYLFVNIIPFVNIFTSISIRQYYFVFVNIFTSISIRQYYSVRQYLYFNIDSSILLRSSILFRSSIFYVNIDSSILFYYSVRQYFYVNIDSSILFRSSIFLRQY